MQGFVFPQSVSCRQQGAVINTVTHSLSCAKQSHRSSALSMSSNSNACHVALAICNTSLGPGSTQASGVSRVAATCQLLAVCSLCLYSTASKLTRTKIARGGLQTIACKEETKEHGRNLFEKQLHHISTQGGLYASFQGANPLPLVKSRVSLKQEQIPHSNRRQDVMRFNVSSGSAVSCIASGSHTMAQPHGFGKVATVQQSTLPLPG